MPTKKTTKETKEAKATVKTAKTTATQAEENVEVVPVEEVSTATVDVEAEPVEVKTPANKVVAPAKAEKKEKVVDYIHGQYLFR